MPPGVSRPAMQPTMQPRCEVLKGKHQGWPSQQQQWQLQRQRQRRMEGVLDEGWLQLGVCLQATQALLIQGLEHLRRR